MTRWLLSAALVAALVLPGCSGTPTTPPGKATPPGASSGKATEPGKDTKSSKREHDPG